MGGIGSGDWYRFVKKTTVEGSLSIGIGDFRKRIYRHSAGTFTWTWAGRNKSSIGYFVTMTADSPTVTLHYRWRDEGDIRISVRLQTTPTNFGGQRWWFTCPLVVDGVACKRRAGKLHLPPGARYFGCRKCHDLTYRSSQEAHQTERFFAGLGRQIGFDTEIGKLLASRIG